MCFTASRSDNPSITLARARGAHPQMKERPAAHDYERAARWEAGIAALGDFRRDHGHVNLPRGYRSPSGFELSKWLSQTRLKARSGGLAQSRRQRLQALGVDLDTYVSRRTADAGQAKITSWTPPPGEGRWDLFYPELVAFKTMHGHLNLPRGYCTASGESVIDWLAQMRSCVNRRTLSAHKIALLTDLGVDLETGRFKKWWQEKVTELAAYITCEGHDRIPSGFTTKSGLALGNWAYKLRESFAGGRLSATRVAELEAIGFSFEHVTRAFDTWEACYPVVDRFVKKFGHVDFPSRLRTPSGKSIGMWFGSQIERLSVGRVSPGRLEQFKALPIRRSGFDIDVVLADVDAYYTRYGNLRFQDNRGERWRNLRENAGVLRLLVLLGELPAQTAERINRAGIGLPGTSRRPARGPSVKSEISREDQWERSFNELSAFHQVHGHLRIPFIQTDGRRPPLYSWLQGQKRLALRGQLNASRRSRLEAIGVTFKDGRAAGTESTVSCGSTGE